MQDNPKVIVLKARQLGITWLALAYYLWEATFEGPKLIVLCSKREDEGKEMLRRLKVLRNNLPPKWRAPLNPDDNSKLSLGFMNGCMFRVLPATESMMRSYAPWGAVIDEMAFMPYQEEMWATVKPAAQRITVVSTGYRRSDFFHQLWVEPHREQFVPVFLRWDADPSRDAAWYEANVTNAIRIRLARREFCADPEEAFASAEGIFFDRFDQKKHANTLIDLEDLQFRHQPIFRAVDFGLNHVACLWLTLTATGRVVVIHEICPQDVTTQQFAGLIHAEDERIGVQPLCTYCDPAGYGRNPQTAQSEMQVFSQANLAPVAMRSAFKDGCVLIQNHLASAQWLLVDPSCKELIAAFETLIPEKDQPDVYAKDKYYGHVMDALRYGIFNLMVGYAGHFDEVTSENVFQTRPTTGGLKSKVW